MTPARLAWWIYFVTVAAIIVVSCTAQPVPV